MTEKPKFYGKTNWQQKFCLGKNFQWQNKKVKALGVWFSTDQHMAISLNYTEKLMKIKSILGCWKFRRLSLVGKIVVSKSLVASQLVYVFSPLQTNHDVIKEIKKLFFNFLWNDKRDKIKRAVIIEYRGSICQRNHRNIRSDIFFEGKIVSKDHLLSLPLWQNSLSWVNNKFTGTLHRLAFERYHTIKTFNGWFS